MLGTIFLLEKFPELEIIVLFKLLCKQSIPFISDINHMGGSFLVINIELKVNGMNVGQCAGWQNRGTFSPVLWKHFYYTIFFRVCINTEKFSKKQKIVIIY